MHTVFDKSSVLLYDMYVRSDIHYIIVNVPCWLQQTHTKRLNILGFQSFQIEELTEKEVQYLNKFLQQSDS